MRRLAGLAVLGLSLVGPLAAQDAGPQVTTSAGWTFSTQDRARGDRTWSTGETAFAGLSARWGNALELSGTVRSDFSGSPLVADYLLDQLSLTWTANSFTILTVGKQRLSWGTARVFSAIDSLEPPLDPVDPKAKPRGVTGVKAELIPLDWLSVWLLALPAPRLDDAVGALRFDVLWDEADLSLGAVRSVSRPLTGLDAQGPLRHRRESPAYFADFARFFDRFGFYGEAQVRQGRNRDWYLVPGLGSEVTLADLDVPARWTLRATGGAQVEFPAWLNGTVRWLTEYHYNGEGFDGTEAATFAQAWARTLEPGVTAFAAPRGLGVGAYRRHYLYSGVSGIPLTEKVSVGTSVLAGLDGGLVLYSASLSWDVVPSLGVSLSFDRFDRWKGVARDSELLFLPYRNRVSASVNAWY